MDQEFKEWQQDTWAQAHPVELPARVLATHRDLLAGLKRCDREDTKFAALLDRVAAELDEKEASK